MIIIASSDIVYMPASIRFNLEFMTFLEEMSFSTISNKDFKISTE